MTNVVRVDKWQGPPKQHHAPERKRGPQVEDGYTRIADELLGALCTADFTAREFRVVHFVIKQTYGWNRKSHRMSASFIAGGTGLHESRASKVLNELIRRKVIIREGGSRSSISLNKHSDQWLASNCGDKTPPAKGAESAHVEPAKSAHDEPTKIDRIDNPSPANAGVVVQSTPSKTRRKWGEPIDHELADQMFDSVFADVENPKRPSCESWANEFRLMRERDNRTVEQIRYLITWTAKHHFWSGVILSPAKLRAKWDQLAKQVKQDKEKRHASGQPANNRRAEQDRVAASLADPHDTSWADGLFFGGSADQGAGESSVHQAGSDFSADVATEFHNGRHAEAGETRNRIFDGEVVNPANSTGTRHGD